MTRKMTIDKLKVQQFATRLEMGNAAATTATEIIHALLKENEYINIIFAAAPSQNEFLAALSTSDIEWNRVNAFHMDEYVGIDPAAPQGFANFLRERLFDKVPVRAVYYINGAAPDPKEECIRYAALLEKYPAHIVFLGIGENTHLAFNDPHVADFNDPLMVKVVDLDDKNRWQQVDPDDPSCFKNISAVPSHAITLTIPALVKVPNALAIVPGAKKADAIYHTIQSEIQEKYPSTILRKHNHAFLFIDDKSASKIGS
jgi:glucosamine-6-phosphate deaminase